MGDNMAEKKTVFLVDDNMTNLMMGKNALKDEYQTFTIPSAAKMFELLNNVKPDLILLDIAMPEMSGFDAVKILKNGGDKNIPIVFLSADREKSSEDAAFALGIADYICKPFSAQELKERVARILD
jgi:putative two-component system response regulator